MRNRILNVFKVAVLIALAFQVVLGTGQIYADLPGGGQCTWHENHCDYTGCTGTCAAQVVAPGSDETQSDACWCLYID